MRYFLISIAIAIPLVAWMRATIVIPNPILFAIVYLSVGLLVGGFVRLVLGGS